MFFSRNLHAEKIGKALKIRSLLITNQQYSILSCFILDSPESASSISYTTVNVNFSAVPISALLHFMGVVPQPECTYLPLLPCKLNVPSKLVIQMNFSVLDTVVRSQYIALIPSAAVTYLP